MPSWSSRLSGTSTTRISGSGSTCWEGVASVADCLGLCFPDDFRCLSDSSPAPALSTSTAPVSDFLVLCRFFSTAPFSTTAAVPVSDMVEVLPCAPTDVLELLRLADIGAVASSSRLLLTLRFLLEVCFSGLAPTGVSESLRLCFLTVLNSGLSEPLVILLPFC